MTPAINYTTGAEINNGLEDKMMKTKYNDKLRVGVFNFENIRDDSGEYIYYYDVWFVTGNLTQLEFEELSALDDTTSSPIEGGDITVSEIRD